MTITVGHFLILAALLFGIGAAGVVTRRNILVIFMSVELMLNAANLVFATFAYYYWDLTGHVFAFIVMVVAACEVAVGLGIILTIFRNRATVNVDEINEMKW